MSTDSTLRSFRCIRSGSTRGAASFSFICPPRRQAAGGTTRSDTGANPPLSVVAAPRGSHDPLRCGGELEDHRRELQRVHQCGGVHPELCDVVPAFRRNGGGDLQWERGIPHREGAYTFTVSGTAARAPFPGLNEDERLRHFGEVIYPNLFLSLCCEHVAAFILQPKGRKGLSWNVISCSPPRRSARPASTRPMRSSSGTSPTACRDTPPGEENAAALAPLPERRSVDPSGAYTCTLPGAPGYSAANGRGRQRVRCQQNRST
jgi:hypothetical protein